MIYFPKTPGEVRHCQRKQGNRDALWRTFCVGRSSRHIGVRGTVAARWATAPSPLPCGEYRSLHHGTPSHEQRCGMRYGIIRCCPVGHATNERRSASATIQPLQGRRLPVLALHMRRMGLTGLLAWLDRTHRVLQALTWRCPWEPRVPRKHPQAPRKHAAQPPKQRARTCRSGTAHAHRAPSFGGSG